MVHFLVICCTIYLYYTKKQIIMAVKSKIQKCYKDRDCIDRFTLSLADHYTDDKKNFKCDWKSDESNECLLDNKECMQLILDDLIKNDMQFSKAQSNHHLKSIAIEFGLTIKQI